MYTCGLYLGGSSTEATATDDATTSARPGDEDTAATTTTDGPLSKTQPHVTPQPAGPSIDPEHSTDTSDVVRSTTEPDEDTTEKPYKQPFHCKLQLFYGKTSLC